jgi:TRAP-type C4-dicarboxylate transport system permease small subunit
MSMTTRKCLSIVSWGASLVFCGLLLFSAYAAAAHKAPDAISARDVIPTIQAQP